MRESVNRSQMDVKRKTFDIRTWEKTFSTRHILQQHWYTCPIALPVRRNPQYRSLVSVVSAISAPPSHHLRLSNVLERISGPRCEPLYTTNTSHRKQETFLHHYSLPWVLLPTKKNIQQYIPQARSPFWLLKPGSEHAHARLLLRLSRSWTLLLPSDTSKELYYSCFTSICDMFIDSPYYYYYYYY
jgi:hypothetical protein